MNGCAIAQNRLRKELKGSSRAPQLTYPVRGTPHAGGGQAGCGIGSEQRPGRLGRLGEPEVRERGRRRRATARSALDETLLEQVGLVDVLDRVLLLPDGDRERREADRAAAELRADRAEDLPVET